MSMGSDVLLTRSFLVWYVTRWEGVKKSESFADVISIAPEFKTVRERGAKNRRGALLFGLKCEAVRNLRSSELSACVGEGGTHSFDIVFDPE